MALLIKTCRRKSSITKKSGDRIMKMLTALFLFSNARFFRNNALAWVRHVACKIGNTTGDFRIFSAIQQENDQRIFLFIDIKSKTAV